MKKIIAITVILIVSLIFIATAYAYGSKSFTENGITYTAVDSCNTGRVGGSIYCEAHCTITPTLRHYSTAQIRKGSRRGTVIATSGRKWTNTASSYASTSAPNAELYGGYGWWGH